MRSAIAGMLLFLVASAADANAACRAVEEHSRGHIKCTRDDFGYTLKYDNFLSRQITLASGKYDEMIETLCVAGGVVRETWYKPFRGTQLRTTHCIADSE
jgi:hypothetical protein